MKSMGDRTLFTKVSAKGFCPASVVEVGVWHPEASNVMDYIIAGVPCVLVEPDPQSMDLIRNAFAGRSNVTLYQCAIYDCGGTVELVRRDASTFVDTLPSSPAIVNDGYRVRNADKFAVQARTFDSIDDGHIDLLSVDTEGSEWFVIKHMVSRPAVVSLETHGGLYVNPFLGDILRWMETNGYRIWYKGKTDTVFARRDAIRIGICDATRLFLTEVYLASRRFRKRLKRPGQHVGLPAQV